MTVPVLQNDIVKITACMTHEDTGDVQNVFWYKQLTGSTDGPTLLSVVAGRFTTAYDYLDDYMPDKISYDLVKGFNITSDLPMADQNWSGLTVGQVDAADPMPSDCCMLVKGRTDGNKVRFRKYLGPFTEADHGNGLWQTSLLAAGASWLSYILTAFASGSGTGQFGVWSDVLETWYPVLSQVVDAVVATQRRRKRYRGS